MISQLARLREVAGAIRGRRLPRRRIFRPQPWPRSHEYARELLRMVSLMRTTAEARILRELPTWVRESDEAHGRLDSASDDAAATFAGIRIGLERGIFSSPAVRPIAEAAARRTARLQKEALQRQLMIAIGVEVPIFDGQLGARVAAFTAENIGLIQSIPRQSLDQVQALVLRGLANGDRPESMEAEIAERFDVSESRAELIATDQTLKFYSSLNEERQTALGITHFIWRTDDDERTCEECAPLDGKRFAWDDAPGGGPGKIHPRCRCQPDPDVDQLLDSL